MPERQVRVIDSTLRDGSHAKAHQFTAEQVARIATYVTEADICEQHIRWARDHGMEAIGVLMMAHMVEPPELVEQARKMESYGAQCV